MGNYRAVWPEARGTYAQADGVMAIYIKPSHKGLLHEKLGVPQGEKISTAKILKALRSKSPALRKEANFARNAKKFHH